MLLAFRICVLVMLLPVSLVATGQVVRTALDAVRY
jgi:hypothetical protein